MKRLLLFVALPLFLMPLTGCGHPAPPPYYAPPPPGAIVRDAYNAGVSAAQRDISRGLPPDVNRHSRFRNPPVPPGQPVSIYRRNFRRGYRSVYNSGR